MPLIESNGTQLFYDLAGPSGAPVIAFSNSIGTTLEMWDDQARTLSGRFRVLRYDTRGHGRSPVAPGPVTIETLADDLAGLLGALGIARAHLVGLSLGGMTAQSFATRHPALLDRLVLMATSAHLPAGWSERAATVRQHGMGAIVDAVMARWFRPAFLADPRVQQLRGHFLANPAEGYAACCLAIGAMDLRENGRAITAPTLIVAGADDPATPPAMSEALRAAIDGAELIVLPRAAHLLNIEQADRVDALLRQFLAADAAANPAGQPAPHIGGVSFEQGLANRKAVLGDSHVERSLANAGSFAGPWQDFITRVAWGEIWGDPTLPRKTRSMLTLALMVSLGREEEFKLHVRPALRNGVTHEELRAVLIQCAVYAGVPASNGAFRWVREVLGTELDGPPQPA